MDNIQELYKERNKVSKDLITRAFCGELAGAFPYVINNANYFVFGEEPEAIPDRYFQEPAVMYKRQVEQFGHHYETVEDHYVPYLMPFMGTGVLCSAFGSRIEFMDKMDPAHSGTVVERVEDLDRLRLPDMEKDGLMPHVIKFLRYFKSHSDIPVGITDCQGPLTTALQLCGYDKLFYWMYDYPKKVHGLMELVTEALIRWVKLQKEVIGEPLNCCAGDQGIYVPEGIGIWFADDDAIILSADLYEEFVIPYNERLMEAFGGGIIHWCGCANQHIGNLNKMKFLRGVNNFSLADAKSLYDLRVGLKKDIALIACDFTPLDYEGFYQTLFEDMKIPRDGLVVQSLFSPLTGPADQKYQLMRREENTVVPHVAAILGRYANLK